MVKAIADATGLTQVDTNKVINELENQVFQTLAGGNKVQLTGFLNIRPVHRAARKGFDPKNREPMDIPATVGVSVKAGEKLKKAVHGLNVADFAPAE